MNETKDFPYEEKEKVIETNLQALFETFKQQNWLNFSTEQENYITSIDTNILVEIFETYYEKALDKFKFKPKTLKQRLMENFSSKKNFEFTKQDIDQIYNKTKSSLEMQKETYKWVHIDLKIKLTQEDIKKNKNFINHTLINWILSFMSILE